MNRVCSVCVTLNYLGLHAPYTEYVSLASTEKNTADSTPVSTDISTSPTIYLLLVRGANFPQFSFQCLPSYGAVATVSTHNSIPLG